MTPRELINFLENFLEENPESADNHIGIKNVVSTSFAEAIIEAQKRGIQQWSISPILYMNEDGTKMIKFHGVQMKIYMSLRSQVTGKWYAYIIKQPATKTTTALIQIVKEFTSEMEMTEFKQANGVK